MSEVKSWAHTGDRPVATLLSTNVLIWQWEVGMRAPQPKCGCNPKVGVPLPNLVTLCSGTITLHPGSAWDPGPVDAEVPTQSPWSISPVSFTYRTQITCYLLSGVDSYSLRFPQIFC